MPIHVDRLFTYFAASGLFNFITSVIIGILILLRARRTEANMAFAFFCLAMSWWSFFYTLWQIAATPKAAVFFCRGFMMGAIFIPILLFHYVAIFTEKKDAEKKWIRRGYALGGVLLLSNFSSGIVAGVEPRMTFSHWPVAGPLFHIHLASFSFYVYKFLHALFARYKDAPNLQKEQIKYLILGSILGFGGGMTNYFLWYGIPIKPFGNALVSVYVAVIAYTILKYRLMDINLVFRYGLIYFIFAVIFSAPLIFLDWWAASPAFSAILLGLSAFFSPIIYGRLKTHLSGAVDQLPPFRNRYKRFQDMAHYMSAIRGARSIDNLYSELIAVVEILFSPLSAALLIYDDAEGSFRIKGGFGLNSAELTFLGLRSETPLAHRMSQKREILIKDLLAQTPSPDADEIVRDAEFLKGEVFAPISLRDALYGVIVLNKKSSGEPYNDLELTTLGTLILAAEQTLQALLVAVEKEQTTAVWAHDLAKPFDLYKGSFKGLLDLGEGRLGPVTTEMIHAVGQAVHDAEFVRQNLHKIIKNHPITSEYDIRPRSLTGVYSRIREKYAGLAQMEKITLTVKIPPEDYKVYCDPLVIEYRVITNLVDNAFRYAGKGGYVDVGYMLEGSDFVGYVKDGGPGIREEDIPKLFVPGAQLNPRNKGVAGLGLYSVHTVIQSHRGRVWVKCPPGQGTTFYFQIPMEIRKAPDDSGH